MKIPSVKSKTDYTRFLGGLDQETSPINLEPGTILTGKNYVSKNLGGYQRIDGYERYDGQPSPSDATYKSLTVSLTGTVSIGDTITGVSSGATGIVAVSESTTLNITKVSGSFVSEEITVSGSSVGNITSITDTASTKHKHSVASGAAADIYRTDILKPSGSFPVRGICMLKGTLYCFVDDVGGTTGQIFKETETGWEEVPLQHEIYFTSGVGLIQDGDTITQDVSGASATVSRVVLTSGAWGTDAEGKLIITFISGTFNSVDNFRVNSGFQATASSTASPITISSGGRYEFVVYNFSADIDRSRIYGCDGANRSFEFDGSVYIPIDVPLSSGASDTPNHINAHKKQLFLHYESGVMHSGVGYPYEYTAVSGANFISLGDKITGSAVLPGKALAIFARNETAQLIGNNINDYKLDSISNEMGAIPYTIQRMGQVLCLDDRGMVVVSPTDAYGNFEQATVSQKIQKLIGQIRQVVIGSSVYRSDDQYRLYGSDGTGICMTRIGDRFDFSFFEYPDNVSCVHCAEDANGKDVVFFGTDEGWVMQADKGSSFDGQDIEAYISLPFNHNKTPTILKTYRNCYLEMSCEAYTALRFYPRLSYNDIFYSEDQETSSLLSGMENDSLIEFTNDKGFIHGPKVNINDVGISLSISIYSKSSIDLGHNLNGLITHYTPRKVFG